MSDNKKGAYCLADNPELYEVQRQNNFEFVVSGLGTMLRAGATGVENNADIENCQEILRIATTQAAVPHFTQEPITIRRGNSVMKAAGVPTFGDTSFAINDYLGADARAVLLAWQNLSYNVRKETVGRMASYKKDCTLIEYDPEYNISRQWILKGCWISGINEPEYNMESSGKKQITATIQYDYAYPVVE